MAAFKVEGKELIKFVKHAREKPMGFAFNPGSKDDHYFGLHRKQPAKAIAKEAKEIGPGKKIAFGEMSVSDKEMRLRCEKQVPGMAKTLKRWLKKQKVKLDVVILASDGTVLEADIDAQDGQEAGGSSGQLEAGNSQELVPEGTLDNLASMERLKAISERIKSLPKEAAAQLVTPYKSVVKVVRSGDLKRAKLGTDKLEAALNKLEQVVQKTTAAKKESAQSDSNEVKWKSQYPKVESAVQATMSAANPNSPDTVELKHRWAKALESASGDAPNYAAALATLPDIVALIKKLRAENEASPVVSQDLKPFVQARLTWKSAIETMDAEIKKLQAEIAKFCQDDSQFESVIKNVPSLADYAAGLNKRLDNALEIVVKSEAGKPREKSKQAVINILKDYRKQLDSEFFKQVDGGNGFTKVMVATTARKALGEIARVFA